MATSPNPELRTPQFLARLRAGDREAFELFFRGWYPALAGYAVRLLGQADAAEDAVQEVFVAVWGKRERLPDGDRLAGYLYRSVRNRSLNQLRQQRTAGKYLATLDPDPVVLPQADSGIEDGELYEVYQAALAELSPRGREVFLLSRDQGLTYPEIAQTLEISVKTVETLMGRALRALRTRLRPRLDIPG